MGGCRECKFVQSGAVWFTFEWYSLMQLWVWLFILSFFSLTGEVGKTRTRTKSVFWRGNMVTVTRLEIDFVHLKSTPHTWTWNRPMSLQFLDPKSDSENLRSCSQAPPQLSSRISLEGVSRLWWTDAGRRIVFLGQIERFFLLEGNFLDGSSHII